MLSNDKNKWNKVCSSFCQCNCCVVYDVKICCRINVFDFFFSFYSDFRPPVCRFPHFIVDTWFKVASDRWVGIFFLPFGLFFSVFPCGENRRSRKKKCGWTGKLKKIHSRMCFALFSIDHKPFKTTKIELSKLNTYANVLIHWTVTAPKIGKNKK